MCDTSFDAVFSCSISSIGTYENQAKDYRKKIDSLGNSIGEYEGELQTLRLRVGSLEDENAKQRELINKLQEQIRALRQVGTYSRAFV